MAGRAESGFSREAKFWGWDAGYCREVLKRGVREEGEAFRSQFLEVGNPMGPSVDGIMADVMSAIDTAVSANDPSTRPADRAQHTTLPVR